MLCTKIGFLAYFEFAERIPFRSCTDFASFSKQNGIFYEKAAEVIKRQNPVKSCKVKFLFDVPKDGW